MQPKEHSGHSNFFSYSADSVNTMLIAAMDTLRKADNIYPFVSSFIEKRGLPVWNKASGSYREGYPVFKVPVKDAQEPRITGIVTIEVKDNKPHYNWTPRGAKVDGILSEELEVVMWVYEKRVFGKTHTDDGRRIETKPASSSKMGNVVNGEPCGRVCLPEPFVAGSCGPWSGDCDGDGGGGGDLDPGPPDPRDEEDRGGGDDDGDRGGGGNQGDNRDDENEDDRNDDDNNNPGCEDIAGNIPFPGLTDADLPSPGCEDDEYGTFLGEIIVDEIITRNDLTKCVYNKLEGSNTFNKLIAKFEGGSSEFDLKFKLAETPGNSFGDLRGDGSNDFIATIDASMVTIRNGIEVASTFLHEAMHAEMRRFLYSKEQGGSTIPGFPGSFTEDWNNYVKEKTGGVGEAEHEAMAAKFTDFIADGLEEFDNIQLDRKHYEALAWDGLLDTKAWKDNADQEEIGQYRNDEAIDDRPQQCSR